MTKSKRQASMKRTHDDLEVRPGENNTCLEGIPWRNEYIGPKHVASTTELEQFWAEKEDEDKQFASIDYCLNITRLQDVYGPFPNTTYVTKEASYPPKVATIEDAIKVFIPFSNATSSDYSYYFTQVNGEIYMRLKLYAHASIGSAYSVYAKNPFGGFRGERPYTIVSDAFVSAINSGQRHHVDIVEVEKTITKIDARNRIIQRKEIVEVTLLKECGFQSLHDSGVIKLLGVNRPSFGQIKRESKRLRPNDSDTESSDECESSDYEVSGDESESELESDEEA